MYIIWEEDIKHGLKMVTRLRSHALPNYRFATASLSLDSTFEYFDPSGLSVYIIQ